VTDQEPPAELSPQQRTRANFDPITGRWSSLVFRIPAGPDELFAGEAVEGWAGRTLPLRFPGGHEEEVRIIAAAVDQDGRAVSITVAPLEAEP
jgi:hypothetical protein